MRGKYRVKAAGTQESEQPKFTLLSLTTQVPIHAVGLSVANSRSLCKYPVELAWL
jgi:hypothetical protein